MSTDVVYSAVRTFLTANWTTTDLAWENENYRPGTDASNEFLPYVAVEVAGNILDQISIGTGSPTTERWREEGIIWLHVMVPSGTGSLTARQHATSLSNLFRGGTLEPDIEFRDMSVGLGEPGTEDGAWYRVSVSIEWIRG